MAVWQYRLIVLPTQGVIAAYGALPNQLFINHAGWAAYWTDNTIRTADDPGFSDAHTTDWWQYVALDSISIAAKVDLLVSRGSWSKANWLTWKGDEENEEDNDCEIAINAETKHVEEFQFRTDLRHFGKARLFLDGMLALCREYQLLVMDDKGGLFEPTLQQIVPSIMASRAAHFLTNPIGFLNKVVDNQSNPS